MSEKNKKIPKIRFKEFEWEWEEVELGETLDYEQPTKYIVENTEYNDNYHIPVLTAWKSFILWKTNEDFWIYENIPAIIFDDFTTDSKFVNFPFKVKSSAIKILKSKNKNNLKFLFESLQNIKYEIWWHQRHWLQIFNKLKIFLPTIEEQEKIANFLNAIDESIELKEKELEKLKEYKKWIMQQIFTKSNLAGGGQNSQILKFKDKNWNDFPEWKEVSLGDVINIQWWYSFKSGNFNNWNNKVLRIWDIKNNIDLSNFSGIYSTEKPSNKYLVKKWDFIIALSWATFGKVWKIISTGEAYINQRIATIRTDFNKEFFYQLFKSDLFQNYLKTIPSASAQPNISNFDIEKFKTFVPTLEEQEKIADFLSEIDEKINLKEKEIYKIKDYKKSLLQNMFV